MTTLWAAAAANDAAAVERLLRDELVPVDDANDLGETALHLAAARGHDATVRVLLQHNASLTTTDWVRRVRLRVCESQTRRVWATHSRNVPRIWA